MEVKSNLAVILSELKSTGREIKLKDLADCAGISNAAMSSLVRWKSLPTLQVALRIARKLDKKVEEIWELIEE